MGWFTTYLATLVRRSSYYCVRGRVVLRSMVDAAPGSLEVVAAANTLTLRSTSVQSN